VKKVSGASRVVVFDHTLRGATKAEREAKLVRDRCSTCTTTTPSGPAAAACATLLPGEAEALLQRRFAIIQKSVARRSINRSSPTRSPSPMRGALAPGPDPRRAPPIRTGWANYRVGLQPGSPLVLFPADAARRGAGIPRYPIRRRTAVRASPAHSSFEGSNHGRKALLRPEHRGAHARFFRFLDCLTSRRRCNRGSRRRCGIGLEAERQRAGRRRSAPARSYDRLDARVGVSPRYAPGDVRPAIFPMAAIISATGHRDPGQVHHAVRAASRGWKVRARMDEASTPCR